MGALRNLRAWANLTYRELESRATEAGDRLPRGTIASAMSRGVMPREQTIAAFVRACGGDRTAVEVWLTTRRRIAAADQAVGDLANAVESWITSHLPGSKSRKVRKERTSSRKRGGTVQPDLATMVEAWLLTRGRFRPDRGVGAGNRAVGWNRDTVAFYTIDVRPQVIEHLTVDSLLEDTTYNLGRVAQAAAETTSSRWVGLHRRRSGRGRSFRRAEDPEVAAV